MVVRHGKAVFRWGDPKRRYDLKSSSKSIGVTALGVALADRKVESLDEPASRSHPYFRSGKSPWLEKISLFHLATQTAGFDKPGGSTALLFAPGTGWSYSDSGPNWLAECITLLYRRDVEELLFERVFTPIGIARNDLRWRKNAYRPHTIEGVARREFGSGIQRQRRRHGAHRAISTCGAGSVAGTDIDYSCRSSSIACRGTVPAVRAGPARARQAEAHLATPLTITAYCGGTMPTARCPDVPRDAYWSWGLYDSLIVVIPEPRHVVAARAGKSLAAAIGAGHYDRAGARSLESDRGFGRQARKRSIQQRGRTETAESAASISGIEWAPAKSIVRLATDSDNWPLAWADDGHLYTAYGDGHGFKPQVKRKLSMGLGRVEGDPPGIRGINVRSVTAEDTGGGASGRKASGMLCVDGTLYMWVRNANKKGAESQLGWSRDHALTWKWANWRFTESFGYPTFISFGRDYAGARDDFVYVVSHDSPSAYTAVGPDGAGPRPEGRAAGTRAIRVLPADRRFGEADMDPRHHAAWGSLHPRDEAVLPLRHQLQRRSEAVPVGADRAGQGHAVPGRVRGLRRARAVGAVDDGLHHRAVGCGAGRDGQPAAEVDERRRPDRAPRVLGQRPLLGAPGNAGAPRTELTPGRRDVCPTRGIAIRGVRA